VTDPLHPSQPMKTTTAFVALFLFPLSLRAQRTPDSVTVFNNVRIFDGKSVQLSAPSNVLVRGNVIVKISAQPIPTDKRGDTKIIDGGGKTLMPGLIDNHVHLFMGASSQAQMLVLNAQPEQMHERAAKEAEAMLLRSFAAARDVGGPVFGLKKSIDGGKGIGPRIYPSGAMISQTSGHGDSRTPDEKSRRFFGKPSKGELLGVNSSPMAATRC
jgi:imidazolonepropionase-like amidohydrolase